MSIGDQQEHFTKEQILDILRHIGFPNPNVLPEPTLETLRELQYRCVTTLPFETLSLRTTATRGVDISLEGIYNRVVRQKRGGWCFSLNRLGFELLYAIGFNVQMTLARVCKPENYGDPIVYGGLTHRISIVRFADGSKYSFDIGFGNSPFYPILLKEGATIEFFGHQRRMVKVKHNQSRPEVLGNAPEEFWQLEEYIGKGRWTPDYAFTEQEYYEVDCEIGNFHTNFSPSSHFYTKFWCVLSKPDGTLYLLMDNEFKIRNSEGTQMAVVFTTEQERLDVLKQYFDIELTEEEHKYHDQKIEKVKA
ncbi:MAG: hypothetical protein J3Q66DRAFT_329743 [Benniella sp.]|nr:MAG: hypothetical protein J3Q66DRAFT_329743 [Benniella sp.]